MRRFPLTLLALVLAACTAGSGATTTTTTGVGTTGSPETTVGSTTTTSSLPPGTEELPEELRIQIAELIATTEELRGLEFLRAPTITVVSDEELADRVRAQVLEDTENVDADQALYILLGLLAPGTDLLQLYLDLYSEQVGGYYDGDVEELVVPAQESELTLLEQWTLVHELTHSLTDQHLELWDRYLELVDTQAYDEASAYLAVIEGDAVLASLLWIRELPLEDQGRLAAEALNTDSTVFNSAPRFIQESLTFPYTEGQVFVERLHQRGGFEAVDEAYRQPPLSTEQVLHPDRYLADPPLEVEVPELTPPGYRQVYDSTWGQLGFELMLRQVLGATVADAAGPGWGGDAYRLYFDGSDVVLTLRFRGDSDQDTAEMHQALTDYVPAAMTVGEAQVGEGSVTWSGEDFAYLARSGDTLTWVVASDPAAGAAQVAALIAG